MSANFDLYSSERVHFSIEEIKLLVSGGTPIKLKKGQPLYSVGDPCDTIYFLQKGTAKYHIILSDGSSRNTAYIKAPDLLGIINVLPDHPALNCCTAVTACDLIACPAGLFLERVQRYNLMDKLFRFATETSRHIYTSLTQLLSDDRIQLIKHLRCDLGLTLQETADFIGYSRVHVSRIMKQIEENAADRTNPQSTSRSNK